MSYLAENVVGIDTQGQYVVVVREMDRESDSLEELNYCLTLLDDDRFAKTRKGVGSTPHLAEETSCIVQYRRLRGREVVGMRSSGGMVWQN